MNAVNGDCSDTQILQIIIQQELQNPTESLLKNLALKTQNFQSKLETLKKKKEFPWHFFGYENKVKHPIYVSKKYCEVKNMWISY